MLDASKGIALFTDGSCYYLDGSGGWAFIAIDSDSNEEVRSGAARDTTNNRMEIQAWIEGLTYLQMTFGPCEVLVYCDSQYVGLGAMDRKRARRKNRDLWKRLDEAMDSHKYVEFVWVRGHHESYYNQLADKLAGQARKGMGSEAR